MRLVVDASTLVGELLRDTGLVLLASPRLDPYVPTRMWEESRHEVSRRLGIRVPRGMPETAAPQHWYTAMRLKRRSLTEVPEEVYEHLEEEALSRLPRGPRGWPVVALALSIDAYILTGDEDFFGCGVAVWTVETLIAQLQRQGRSPFS